MQNQRVVVNATIKLRKESFKVYGTVIYSAVGDVNFAPGESGNLPTFV